MFSRRERYPEHTFHGRDLKRGVLFSSHVGTGQNTFFIYRNIGNEGRRTFLILLLFVVSSENRLRGLALYTQLWSRGTTQKGVLFPLLWMISVDKLLRDLTKIMVKR